MRFGPPWASPGSVCNFDSAPGEATTSGCGFSDEGVPVRRQLVGRSSVESDGQRLSVELVREEQPGRVDFYAVVCCSGSGVASRFALPAVALSAMLPDLSKILSYPRES